MSVPDVLIGNLFESQAQTLVNTVNTVGVMGKGVALAFKKRFPEMYEDYVRRCRRREVRLGEPYLFRPLLPPWVLNFPTKDHWRSVSRLADIIKGLEYLEQHSREWAITSLAVPPLGCGQGQLEWRVVGPTLYRHLRRLEIPVELNAPEDTPPEQLAADFLGQEPTDYANSGLTVELVRIKPAWVALAEIVARIEREPYHWPVGRVVFQKIAYFATELGLPTGLRHVRGSYGPFAADLKLLTTRLVNNGVLVEEKEGRRFTVRPGPTFEDAVRIYRKQLAGWDPIIERVVDLFLRMQPPQAEVAATVHFSAQALTRAMAEAPSEEAIFDAVKEWKQRRNPPLEDEEIGEAIRHLNILDWINAQPSESLPVPNADHALAET